MTNRSSGIAIVLNGTSSSGKTSIARALQAKWEGPLLLLGVDMMIGMMPFHYTGAAEHAAEGYLIAPGDKDGKPHATIAPGPLAYALNTHLADLTARLLDEGHDVVVDLVIPDDETLAPFIQSLKDKPAWFVGVRCDLAEAERRELARGDRLPGTVRAQHQMIHKVAGHYDLELDTSTASTDELSSKLIDHLRMETPAAFRKL